MTKEKFEAELIQFINERETQKIRGLNSYNPLTTVLSYHDEVRLHSRMIGSLLKINGEHYQGDLFLKEFLKIIELPSYFDLQKTEINVEYKDIDLYITDGTRHLIIENKIWAEDQPCQLIKYINIIINEIWKKESELLIDEKTINKDILQVIYLTPHSRVPNRHKIDKDGYITFSGTDEELLECSSKEHIKEYLENKSLKNYHVKYKNITYEKEISDWLAKSQKEVSNITNLNSALQYYRDAVLKVFGRYESPIKQYKDFFLLDKRHYQYYRDLNEEKENSLFDNKAIEDEKEFIKEGYEKATLHLLNGFYIQVLKPILEMDGIKYKKFYINLTSSGKINNDGSIIFFTLNEVYDLRIYIKDNKFKTISIGPNNDIYLSEDQKKDINMNLYRLEKIDLDKNERTYITGTTKGKKIESKFRIPDQTTDNLFDLSFDSIDNEIKKTIIEHINTIRKSLESTYEEMR